MRRSAKRTAIGLPILVAGALSLLTACQESLPAYESPATPLEVDILIDPRLQADELSSFSPDFGVRVRNASDETDSWVLPVPWEVSLTITVFLVRDPGRKIEVAARGRYTDPIDDLTWGYYVVLPLNLPVRDSGGRTWNWGYGDIGSLELALQGRARIPQLDLEVNIGRVTTILEYPVP